MALTTTFVQWVESEDSKVTVVTGSGHRMEDAVIGSVALTRWTPTQPRLQCLWNDGFEIH